MMVIRYLTDYDDRNEISRIYEENWRYAYRELIPQDYLDSIHEGRRAKNFDIPGWNTMVCIENGKYIGTNSFTRSRSEQYPDPGEVISIYFLPEYIGKGYGKQLLKAVVDELKNKASPKYSCGFSREMNAREDFMRRSDSPVRMIIRLITSAEKTCAKHDTFIVTNNRNRKPSLLPSVLHSQNEKKDRFLFHLPFHDRILALTPKKLRGYYL